MKEDAMTVEAAMPVTLSQKRYVFACVGCGKLTETDRRHTLTCRGACRVRAHRNGEMKRLQDIAKGQDVRVSVMQQARAIVMLCPELEAPILAGTLTIEAAMPQVCAEFDRLVLELVRKS